MPRQLKKSLGKILVFIVFTSSLTHLIPPCSLAAKKSDHLEVIKTETGVYYTIKKGDTLWDLSRKFLDSEWAWPDVWTNNNTIGNPHLIYPGQKIRIFHKNELEKPVQIEDQESRRPHYFYSKIDNVGSMKHAKLLPSGIIFKVRNDKLLAGEGDTVYIKSLGRRAIEPGEKYSLYRTFEPKYIYRKIAQFDKSKAKNVKTLLGIQHYRTGVIKIVRNESGFSVGKIIKSYRTIQLNDMLTPYQRRSPQIPLVESTEGISGKIITSEEQEGMFGDNTVAFINKGDLDGIIVGQEYNIYYPEKKRAWFEGMEKNLFVPVDFAKLIVLHTEKSTSTVLITSASKDIYPGSMFRSPAL